MRVAIYTRISTDEEHQPYSLEAQDTRLGAYIASQDGWELTRRYSDRMTGSVLERPELQRALGDARLHRFDLLLVYRVDRMSRSVRGLAQILEELDHAHVLFRSATERSTRPTDCRTDRFALCQEWWAEVDSNHLPSAVTWLVRWAFEL